jgi:hypothetical protein
MISEHAENIGSLKIVDFKSGAALKDLATTAYRLRLDYDEVEGGATMTALLSEYVESKGSEKTHGLVIGSWCGDGADSSDIVEALVTLSEKLPNLRMLFMGDIVVEENEISWIPQSDMSPLFNAFPNLEYFRVRGNTGLALGRIKLAHLKSLIVETGGLSVSIIRDISQSELPALEHLELWLGTDNYGWDGSVDDLKPILSGELFPKLKYLGLRDSEIADEIAQALAKAPILNRIETLDLSMGTLSDVGGEALLAAPGLKKLKYLDLHHHYLSNGVMKKLAGLSINVNIEEKEEGDEDDRYVSVSE